MSCVCVISRLNSYLISTSKSDSTLSACTLASLSFLSVKTCCTKSMLFLSTAYSLSLSISGYNTKEKVLMLKQCVPFCLNDQVTNNTFVAQNLNNTFVKQFIQLFKVKTTNKLAKSLLILFQTRWVFS